MDNIAHSDVVATKQPTVSAATIKDLDNIHYSLRLMRKKLIIIQMEVNGERKKNLLLNTMK